MKHFYLPPSQTRFVENPDASAASGYPQELRAALAPEDAARAAAEIQQWPGYAPTPLHSLDELAARANVRGVYYKDESGRFGLGSFKALGGAYAVFCLLAELVRKQTGKTPNQNALAKGEYAGITKNATVASATDGNHGRAVAWGAKMFGCQCRIYIHAEVSESRKRAIESFGATVVRIDGDYDESVRRASEDAHKNGWRIVSDTECPGCGDAPRQVMAGYCTMLDEILRQIPEPPTHVFVQGGVGGLAAAACARLWHKLGARRPHMTVVEPELAGCLHKSAELRRPTNIKIAQETIMAGLSCGEPSPPAWEILRAGARGFMLIPDETVAPLMRLLARRTPPIEAGESGVAGLAGFLAAAADDSIRKRTGLDSGGNVLVLGTEGATDAEIYARLTAASGAAD